LLAFSGAEAQADCQCDKDPTTSEYCCTAKLNGGGDADMDASYNFHWTIKEEVLYGKLELANMGERWLGVGIRTDYKNWMEGTTFFVGDKVGEKHQVYEYHPSTTIQGAASKEPPTALTTNLMWNNGATYENGVQSYEFMRPFDPVSVEAEATVGETGNPTQITADGQYYLLWAHGADDDASTLANHGTADDRTSFSKQSIKVDLRKGPNTKSADATTKVVAMVMFFLSSLVVYVVLCLGLNRSDSAAWKINPAVKRWSPFLVFTVTSLITVAFIALAQERFAGFNLNSKTSIGVTADVWLFYATMWLFMAMMSSNLATRYSIFHFYKRFLRWVPALGFSFFWGEFIIVSSYIILNAVWVMYYTGTISSVSVSNDATFARVMAHLAELNTAYVLMPVTRHSIWAELFSVPYERALKYHRFLGWTMFMWTTIHMGGKWLSWIKTNDFITIAVQFQSGKTKGNAYNTAVWTGELVWFMLVLLIVSAFNPVRRKRWELFFFTHQLYFPIFIFTVWHCAVVPRGGLQYYIFTPAILWAIDQAIRNYRHAKGYMYPKATWETISVEQEMAEVVTITLKTPRPYFYTSPRHAGQYGFLCIPAISNLEWHPFTISSAPSEKEIIRFHIKNMGHDEWSERLWHLAGEIEAGVSPLPKILYDGPFGAPSQNLHDYANVLMVTGGIGCTPIFAEMESIMDAWDHGHRHFKSVTIIWTVRDPLCIDWFSNPIAKARNHESGIFHVRLFATKAKQTNPDTIEGRGPQVLGPYRQDMSVTQDDRNGPYRESIVSSRTDMQSNMTSNQSLQSRFFGRSVRSNSRGGSVDTLRSANSGIPSGGGNLNAALLDLVATEKVKGINIPEFEKGRPNMNKELDAVLERACTGKRGQHVRLAVFICGPAGLVNSMEVMTAPDNINKRKSMKGARLQVDLHHETFDF
jgi:NAD(P)H-flavin reductase